MNGKHAMMTPSNEKSENISLRLIKKVTMGSTYAFLCVLWVQPLDFLKTRIQENPIKSHISLFKYTKHVVEKQGILQLWSGSLPAAIRIVPGMGMYFGLLETITLFAKNECKLKVNSNVNLAVGALSRFIVLTMLHPISIIKTRYESKFYNYSNLFHAFVTIKKREGYRGFYQGYLAAVMKDVPSSGINYSIYRMIQEKKDYCPKLFNNPQYNNIEWNLISGFISGALSTAITQPIDLIKTRVQVCEYKAHNSYFKFCRPYISIVNNFKHEHIFQTIKKGFILSCMKKCIGSGILYTLYDLA